MEKMTKDVALEFLAEGARTGKIATASPDGVPHVAPVWFVLDGEHIVFTTGWDSVKGRNLRANPRAALTVDIEDFPFTFVLVRGAATIERDAPDLHAWTTKLATRYVPPELVEDYAAKYAQWDELCRLRIDSIVGVKEVALH
jgi:PPOX class probable F420-dependent enzyme